MPRIRSTVSAGGVVIRPSAEGFELLVVRRTKNVEPKWQPVLCQLPKGMREKGEGLRAVALREVLEETGYSAVITRKAGIARWRYRRGEQEWEEIVHYYVMRLGTAEPGAHDEEFEEVVWLALDRGAVPLSYPEERELIANAKASGFLTGGLDNPSLSNTKAGRLAALNGSLGHAVVDDFLTFSVASWNSKRSAILSQIRGHFPVDCALIVRSSAIDEDKRGGGLAGALQSERVNAVDRSRRMVRAVANVAASFARQGRAQSYNDRIIVQSLVENVALSGVVITQDVWHHPSYYLINFDEESGETFHVTAGLCGRAVRIFRGTPVGAIPARWTKLIAAVRELESKYPDEALLIEFAVDRNGVIHIFQVRDLQKSPQHAAHSRLIVTGTEIGRLQKQLARLAQTSRGVVGRQTIFSDMADWNPAEMLGPRPATLDLSLYRYLITSGSWNEGRVSLGYTDVAPAELLVVLGDKPYIDVRVSLNSLTPAIVPQRLRAALVEWGVDALQRRPEWHDKIEFQLAMSCFDLGIDQRLRELTGSYLNRTDANLLRRLLVEFTNKLVATGNDMLARDDAYLNRLRSVPRQTERNNGFDCQLQTAVHLMARCRKSDVVLFSRVARLAFVGLAILESLEKQGAITSAFRSAFLQSQRSVADEVRSACHLLSTGKLSRAGFLAQFGHLRPMTYDITSARYDKMPRGFWTKIPSQRPVLPPGEPRLTSASRTRIDRMLGRTGLLVNSTDLLRFIGTAIRSRELAKFIFTRDLSDALEVLARCGEDVGLTRAQLTAIPWEEIRRVAKGGRIDRLDAAAWLEQGATANLNRKRLTAVALPPIIASDSDVNVVDYPVSSPNFVTRKKISGPRVAFDRTKIDGDSISKGIVLLENADPGFDWIFQYRPWGLVTKYGGAGSHMTIRCAAFGIPAAIGCGEVVYSNLLKADVMVLDCAAGTIAPMF